jgi:uncharacterized membrane protein YoaK (UPF0700 family)
MKGALTRLSIQRGWSGTASVAVDPPPLALPCVLSVIAGSTDTIGFLGLNGLFTAHITGNFVILAAHVITGDPAVLSYLLAVPVFMLVLLFTRLFASYLERAGTATLPPLLLLQFLSLMTFLVLCVICGRRFGANSAIGIIAGMSGVTAMAVQNALVQISLTRVPSTAVMTTNVAHFMLALGQVLAGGDAGIVAKARQRVSQTGPVILGFILGCAMGAEGQAVFGFWSLGLPTALALLTVVMSAAGRADE